LPNPGSERAAIGLRLENLSDLFDRFDPAPIPDGELAPEIADYVIGRANEYPNDQLFDLSIHLPPADAEEARRLNLTQNVQAHFRARAERERDHLSEVFRSGRQALAIGLAVLAICLSAAWLLGDDANESTWLRLVQESLVVVGWVVIWRPAEIFLYDWIPIERQKKLLLRLADSTVVVIDDDHAPPNAPL
jgi:hypothetical protein